MSELIDSLKGAYICVYGCGECGLQIYFLLREKGITVKIFSDRDNAKKGYVVGGVYCITYEELLSKDRGEIALLVAVAHGRRLVKEFEKLGFQKIYYYEDVIRAVYEELPGEILGEEPKEIEELYRLKQRIEEFISTEERPESKRDHVLGLIEGWQVERRRECSESG